MAKRIKGVSLQERLPEDIYPWKGVVFGEKICFLSESLASGFLIF